MSLGIGYVAISLYVMGEFVGAHEMAEAIMEKAERLDGRGGERQRPEEEEEVDRSQEG